MNEKGTTYYINQGHINKVFSGYHKGITRVTSVKSVVRSIESVSDTVSDAIDAKFKANIFQPARRLICVLNINIEENGVCAAKKDILAAM